VGRAGGRQASRWDRARGEIAPELLLLEYEHLKEELRLRISTRDNLVYTTLGAFALVIAGSIQTRAAIMLALVPPVCFVLGWTYLANDDRITAIGLHIQRTIGPQLARIGNPGFEVFGWERLHRSDNGRNIRKTLQLTVDLGLYCVTALTALIATWIWTPHSGGLISIILLESVGIATLGLLFVKTAINRHIPRFSARSK
jgi:hypothetical protein